MKMKKIFALILVIALAAVVCVSCAKKEEPKTEAPAETQAAEVKEEAKEEAPAEEKEEAKEEAPAEAKEETSVNYTIYNRTGETIIEITLTDKRGSSSVSGTAIADGESLGLSLSAVLEDGVPDLQLNFKTDSGEHSSSVMVKDSPITLLPLTSEGEVVSYEEPKE